MYFVGGVSATFPPIKIYNYNGTVQQLDHALNRYVNIDSTVKIKISRRDSSNYNDNGDRDIVITLKSDAKIIEYGLVCDTNNGNKTKVNLISAFTQYNIGGYSIKSPEVKALSTVFEKKILIPLRKHHVDLQPDLSFWDNFSIY